MSILMQLHANILPDSYRNWLLMKQIIVVSEENDPISKTNNFPPHTQLASSPSVISLEMPGWVGEGEEEQLQNNKMTITILFFDENW